MRLTFRTNFLCVTNINNLNADIEVLSSDHTRPCGASSQSFGDCLRFHHQTLMTSSPDNEDAVSETWDITSISIFTGPITLEDFIAYSHRRNFIEVTLLV